MIRIASKIFIIKISKQIQTQSIKKTMARKTWIKILCQISIFFIIVIGLCVYGQWSFPSEYKHLYPQKFQSHPVRDLADSVINWHSMKAQLFNNTLPGMCQDFEVTKNDIAYCMNENNQIVEIDTVQGKMKVLATGQKGRTYGLRLSRDEKLLYFANSQLGLCEFNIKSRKITVLVRQYLSKPLIALNSIQTHPTNPNLLYITESSSVIPLKHFNIDILMNNALGRLFEFNKKTQKLSLLTEGLHFANGVVFQQYQDEETVLVAESNRFRLTRVYVKGYRRGEKQVAVDKLDVYLDNMKANQKGEIWVAAVSMRSTLLQYADYHPWMRRIATRLPQEQSHALAQLKYFGGVKIKFTNGNKNYNVEYLLWESFPGFKFSTTVNEKNNKLYISSLKSKGVFVVDDLKKKLKKKKLVKNKEEQEEEEAL